MALLVLLCGLPGSGKTTLARQLEQTLPAVRLCPVEWIAPILADAADTLELDRLRSTIESLQWDLTKRLLVLGTSVILEWGFWSQQERAYYRAEAQALGAQVQLRFLRVPRDELWARLSRRNASLPSGTFHVTQAQLDEWWSTFQPPTADELT